jgi:hypothetical protein
VTLLGDLGPWRERLYLVGGLAPRYLVGRLPEGVPPHVGTTDVDLVVALALGDETSETYETLQKNLEGASFEQVEPSFRWVREVDGVSVAIEFLCETDAVEAGRIYRPRSRGEFTGPKLGAFNVPGAHLARQDFIEVGIDGERLDAGGKSHVTVRVANIVPFTVLKVFAFQDRHENKDAYDLVFTLLNHRDGPRAAGVAAAESPIADHPQVRAALSLLEERFRDPDHDGAAAYAAFLAQPDDDEDIARLRRQAVATVQEFLEGFGRRS